MKSLEILIPTLPERHAQYNTIFTHLNNQIGERSVTIMPDARGRFISIGRKRDEMLKRATGDYVVFIDDDDMVTHDYVEKVYDAIQSEPDVVGFRGYMTTNRQNSENWIISIKYDWATDVDGFRYVRYPNHLSPIKREIALSVGFPDLRHGEDYNYSMALKESGKLQKEFFIDKELYHYDFRHK